jgi:ATP-dependent DNA helicase PIF1
LVKQRFDFLIRKLAPGSSANPTLLLPPQMRKRPWNDDGSRGARASAPRPTATEVMSGLDLTQLDGDQREAVRRALVGENLFLTGGPGVGKSHTLRVIVDALRCMYGTTAVHVTAPTGAAALLVGGQTLNAFPGPGVPSGTVEAFETMRQAKRAAMWRRVAVLVIDEISMVDGEFLDWFMEALPWPLQLVVCGDFFQLAPVKVTGGSSLARKLDESMYLVKAHMAQKGSAVVPVTSDEEWISRAEALGAGLCVPAGCVWKTTPYGLGETTGSYAFQSMAWRRARFSVVNLGRVYRTTDDTLINAQRAIREGAVDSDAVRALVTAAARPLFDDDGIVSTVVVPRRQTVADINTIKLRALDVATECKFAAEDSAMPDGHAGPWVMQALENDAFYRDCPADKEISLRIGAQVMLIKNEPASDGGLVNGSRGVVVAFRPSLGHVGGPYRFVPERLGEEGADPPSGKLWPVVRFVDGSHRLCAPVEFKKKIYGRGTCSRRQVPLTLAWAITVHKAQGASLDRVTVDLEGAFTEGQTYVAISRARTLEGLELRNFSAASVRTHPLVREFYASLGDGSMEEFLARRELWWGAPLLAPSNERWKQLYEQHPCFAQWIAVA